MTFREIVFAGLQKVVLTKRQQLAKSPLISMLLKGLRYTDIQVNVVFEIGANHGQDAVKMQKYFNVKGQNMVLFEPHPELADELKRKFSRFRVFNCALSDKSGFADFNIVKAGSGNDGVSTLGSKQLGTGKEDFEKVSVQVSTLDEIMMKLPEIDHIDVVKIDVEGFSYEVLKGGKETFRNKVACIQIESETKEVFKGRKLYPEIAKLLSLYGFEEKFKEEFLTQNDTVWIKSNRLLSPESVYQKIN